MFSLDTGPVLRLVQITDTHLHGDENGQLVGINTWRSLQSVIELVRARPTPDAMIISGDISQDCSFEAYQHLQTALAPFACPKFWFNGNHDYPAHMQQISANTEYGEQIIRTPHWQLIFLNSQVEGSVFGLLSKDQLELLEHALEEQPQLHTLISFHHHPIPMGSQWLDRIGLRNAEEFLAIIDQHPQVRCVLWGHVHQSSDRMRNEVRFLSTPSTCVQFLPNSDDFAVDRQAPGYRWLDLHADGSINTAVERVNSDEFMPDINSNGY